MRLREKKRADFLVDITPLIDVVFLMLIFFMVSTSFSVSSNLKLDLPSSHATASDQEVKQVTIGVDATGQLYVQDEPVSDEELRKRILNASKGDSGMRVVLRADADARHKRIVYVLDTLSELDMTHVGIATVTGGSEEKR